MYSEYNGIEVSQKSLKLFQNFEDVGVQRSEPSNVVASLFWTTLYTAISPLKSLLYCRAANMNLSSRQPGPVNGLRLYLWVDQANYLYSMSSSAGFRVGYVQIALTDLILSHLI